MSCCEGNCRCGSAYKCRNGCGGCGMYLDIEKAPTTTMIVGVAPPVRMYTEGSEENFGEEGGGHGCKCRRKCTCGRCT